MVLLFKALCLICTGNDMHVHLVFIPVFVMPVQGLMYGYATDETPEFMPLTAQLAHNLNKRMADCRRNGTLPWIRPDSKSQVMYTCVHYQRTFCSHVAKLGQKYPCMLHAHV